MAFFWTYYITIPFTSTCFYINTEVAASSFYSFPLLFSLHIQSFSHIYSSNWSKCPNLKQRICHRISVLSRCPRLCYGLSDWNRRVRLHRIWQNFDAIWDYQFINDDLKQIISVKKHIRFKILRVVGQTCGWLSSKHFCEIMYFCNCVNM